MHEQEMSRSPGLEKYASSRVQSMTDLRSLLDVSFLYRRAVVCYCVIMADSRMERVPQHEADELVVLCFVIRCGRLGSSCTRRKRRMGIIQFARV